MKKEKFFKLFLVIYVGFLVMHTASLPWDRLMVPLSLSMGFGVALLAHTRYGILTIGLLLIHMGLEWTEYARHGWHFSTKEIVLHGIHVCLDFVFLYQELKMHVKRFRIVSFVGVIGALVVIFISNYQSPPKHPYARIFQQHAHTHTHGNSGPIAPFVLGGMFGCILYHLKRQEVST